ncbi:MAG: ketoacyl-ACP synthase III [Deltaproteobacteria bacterium]|nr:ketoacyl-ACP synthase III [Deltaproteobacteria bacterium]
MRVKITGTGMYAPPRVETAEELSDRVGKPLEWILERTRVARRHISDGEQMDEMGAKAVRQALGEGGPPDLLINASLTPVQLVPDSSVFLLERLGLEGTPSFSIHATCLSFLVALHTASGLVSSGAYRRVAVVSSEQSSTSRNLDEPESGVLLGDGSGAAVIEATPEGEGSALLAFKMTTWPSGKEHAQIPGCGTRRHPNHPGTVPRDHLFHMDGPSIYKAALRRVAVLHRDLFVQAGLTPDDIDLVVPHQASGKAVSAIERFGYPMDKVVDIVEEYGNCVAASIPMALATAVAQGRLKRGDKVLFLGTGAGLSVAGAILRW